MDQKIPIADLGLQHRLIQKELDAAIQETIASSAFIQGPQVKAFEKEFAAYCGASFAAGAASGTAALELILAALGIRPGDEVITTPFTFIATAEAISRCGAKPVFADVDREGALLDPVKAASVVTPKTRAVIAVHLYGQCADMEALSVLAREKKLVLIEDAAQAQGAEFKNRRAGSLAPLAAFSFYPGKNLGAMGDAGAVLGSDEKMIQRARLLADHGRTDKYEHQEAAFNCRLDGIQAAILRVKLRHLERWNDRRRAIAGTYRGELAKTGIKLPAELPGRKHVYHQFTIRSPRRDALKQSLASQGIETGIHYPIPLHLQSAYRHLGYENGAFPEAEAWAREALSLPIYPEMTEEQVERVIKAVLSAV